MENWDFAELLAAVRAGDRQAAAELARRYETQLRSLIRLHLRGSPLCSLLDSLDVYQSILVAYFTRDAAKPFDLQTPDQLAGLLVCMALNKLATAARHNRRGQGSIPADCDPLDPRADPASQVARSDLLRAVRAKLSAEEWALFEQNRVVGKTWNAIAAEIGDKPAALRMRLTRALKRVREELRQEGISNVF
jgi:DNA-directed RNA polymerase specialized sigma24 family protein